MEKISELLFIVLLALLNGEAIYRLAICLAVRHVALIGDAYVPGRERFIRRRFIYSAAGILFFCCARQTGWSGELLAGWILMNFLLLIAVVDLEYQYIFNEVLVAFSIFGLLLTPYLGDSLFDRLGGALAGFGMMLLLSLPSRGAIGGGDIKLMAVLGLWLGLGGVLSALFAGIFSGGIVALILLCCKRKKRTDFIAYGPHLALGAVLYWFGWISL